MAFTFQTTQSEFGRLKFSGAHRPRTVVHLNIADFAVAVERRVDQRLKDYPVIIAPEESARSVVYDMSDEAFRSGVRKQMPLKKAMRCCRDAILVPPHPDRYEQAMHDILREVLPYSPLIEPGETDGHVFIDTTGTSRLFGPPVDVAWRMYRRIKKSLGFSPVWSVSPNKLVAKVATRLVKPMGEYIVGQGEEAAFLAPLPVFLLPGIEKEDLLRFRALNLSFVNQIAGLTLDQLAVPFGKRAGFVFDSVRGIDPSQVLAADQKPPRIIAGHEFGKDTNAVEAVERVVYQLVEKIGDGLRQHRKAARVLAVVLDHSDGVRRVRQMKVNPPSANDISLFKTARSILYTAWTRRVRLRHIRLICENPVFPPAQLDLFPDPVLQNNEVLIAAMDRIRHRFGKDMIQMGRSFAS
jgi:DNA polymerase-4